ncbi:hypothetical protein FS842_007820 [Serendipita sp. 407]|nr:hypothetical protein FS842_007820 [Serendipita sp. 407]
MSTSATPSKPAVAEEEPFVLFHERHSARIYTLNRPSKLNALSHGMVQLLHKQIRAWDDSELCKVIIGTGKGQFCAGGDVAQITTQIQDSSTRDRAVEFFRDEFMLDFHLSQLQKPYVVIMDGFTMGGGVGLSMHAPFRIATERTMFAMPETDIGYFTDVGATHFLAHLDGQLGTYLGLSSKRIQGREVFECGIATHYVHSRNIPLLLERLSRLEEANHSVIDETIDEFYEHRTPGGSGDVAPYLVGDVRNAIDQAFRPRDPNQIIENLDALSGGIPIHNSAVLDDGKSKVSTTDGQDRDTSVEVPGEKGSVSASYKAASSKPAVSVAVETWAKETATALRERSPTSICITREAIFQAKEMTLKAAFEMEMGLAQAFCTDEMLAHDFVEGVQAKLIDKGKKGPPKWRPSTIRQVDMNAMREVVHSASSLTVPPTVTKAQDEEKTKKSTKAMPFSSSSSSNSSSTSAKYLPEGFVLEAVASGDDSGAKGEDVRVAFGLPTEDAIRKIVMEMSKEKGKPRGKGEEKGESSSESEGEGETVGEGEGKTSQKEGEAVEGLVDREAKGSGDAMTALGVGRTTTATRAADPREKIVESIMRAYKGKPGVRERVYEVLERKCVERKAGNGSGLEWRE